MSVHATIIDLKEIDDAMLAEAATKRGAIDPDAAKAELLSRHVGRDTPIAATSGRGPVGSAGAAPSHLPDSVAAIRARNVAAADERAGEAAKYFAQAQQAEADGKPAVARIFYQMVARRDTGPLKQQAEARLAALAGAKVATMTKR